MKVKTFRCFYDLKDDCYRNEGDVFEVTKARFDQLNSLVPGFVEDIDVEDIDVKENDEEEKASKK